uniref:guanylate cyclase n=1 Tax=Saccoglossus kowalevskii TaxID=10224 RepID=A0ABM0MQI1_SACKO|nr:PREDICTED: guanylate cyclase soluble subunit beta-2-like [Saccoglossus kowalevskii]
MPDIRIQMYVREKHCLSISNLIWTYSYGIINICIKELVLERYGEEVWEKIRNHAKVDDQFINYNQYPDHATYALVASAAQTLDVSEDVVWELFGEFWVIWCMRAGFDSMIRALGSSMSEFIANLDYLHSVYMKTSYPKMTVPSFRVENLEDGTIMLHYYSNRRGMKGVVIGIVRAVGNIIFDTQVTIDVLDCREETEGGKKEHTTFIVRIDVVADEPDNDSSNDDEVVDAITPLPAIKQSKPSPRGSLGNLSHFSCSTRKSNVPLFDESKPVYSDKLFIEPETFCISFPYHLVFNQDMEIVQCGAKLQKLCPRIKSPKVKLEDFITMQHPQIPIDIMSFRKFINMIFMVELKRNQMELSFQNKPLLSLRGQMVWMEKLQCIAFFCSPRLTTLQDLEDRNMYFSDIAPHDVTRDLILFNQQRVAEIELARQLEQKKEELRTLMKDLQEEKLKTDMLLHSMLPQQVANDLREGRKVEAGEYDQVTVLFSDVVKFTDMCAVCKPIQIVHLLNEMYVMFDRLTSVHDVYKIRVGIHSGPVVAGVVGQKMPRYCLFGDTVNTASRMESHGINGKIHTSPNSYK